MIRTLGIEPSSKMALSGLTLTKTNYVSYRKYLLNKILRSLLPTEKYRIHTGLSSLVQYYPDGSYRIQYDNSMITGLDYYQILDIQLGYVIHECSHVIYTDFKGQIKFLDELVIKYPDIDVTELHKYWNVIEDVRIESRISKEIPGAGNYIREARLRVSHDALKAKTENPENFGTVGLLTLVYNYYTVPELFELWIDDPDVNEYGYKREDIERICIIPELSSDAERITKELLALLSPKERKDMKTNRIYSKFITLIMESFGIAGATEILKKLMDEESDVSAKPIKTPSSVTADSDSKLPKSDSHNKVTNPDPDSNKIQSKKEDNNGDEAPLPKFTEGTEVDAKVSETSSSLPECDDDSRMMEYFPTNIHNETVDWKSMEWNSSDKYEYEDIVRRVVGNSAAVLRAAFMKYNVGGWSTKTLLESGKPDRRFIHRAMMNDTRVFKSLEKRENSPLDVIILIDESGSMSGGGKSERAREVAILLHEALLGIKNINYWCYGHTTGGWGGKSSADVAMSIYHEGPVLNDSDKYKLMRIHASSGNCDGRAILEAAGRVRRRITPDRTVLFILISDGSPTESCSGISPNDYARKAAKYVQTFFKYNFIHVGIDCCNKTLYEHSIDYTNPDQLARQIGSVVSEFVVKSRGR